MKKALMAFVFILISSFNLAFAAGNIVGFWKTIDEDSGKPQSLIGVYEHQGRYFGRIILTYDDNGNVADTIYAPKERAPGLVGKPYYAGLDLIWDLKQNGNKFTDGHIVDPEKGKIYGAELWVNSQGELIVRGKLLFFGRNQTWPAANEGDFPADFKKPDLNSLIPTIPRVK
jgi:uncharacterized protein (DUF2147 family)